MEEIDSDMEYLKEMEDQRIEDQKNGGFIRQPVKKQSNTRPCQMRMQVSTTGWQLDMEYEASSLNAMNLDAELLKGEYSLKDAYARKSCQK